MHYIILINIRHSIIDLTQNTQQDDDEQKKIPSSHTDSPNHCSSVEDDNNNILFSKVQRAYCRICISMFGDSNFHRLQDHEMILVLISVDPFYRHEKLQELQYTACNWSICEHKLEALIPTSFSSQKNSFHLLKLQTLQQKKTKTICKF